MRCGAGKGAGPEGGAGRLARRVDGIERWMRVSVGLQVATLIAVIAALGLVQLLL